MSREGPRVEREERATIRCRGDRCGRSFEISVSLLGRNVYCLHCGRRMTARPVEVEREIRRREREKPGWAGATGLVRLPLRVVVDNVRSLWNVGSIFRTADVCGVDELVLAGITGCPPRAEIEKTALGAEKMVAWRYVAEAAGAIDSLAAEGYAPVALETGRETVPVHEFEWPPRVCLVIGNEVAGVGDSLLARCPHRVAIPMYGGKDSLNVAVAFGIAAHAAARALSGGGR